MNNKIINIYELIGLIKDGKAPKRIKVTGHTYEFDEELNTYITRKRNYKVLLGGVTGEINLIANIFNEIVEILPEEENEWEDIEEIEQIISSKAIYDNWEDITKDIFNIVETVDNLIISFNQLIKNQKYLKKKMERNKKSTEFHVETDMYGSAYVADEYGNPYRSKITETEKTC